MYSVTFSKCNAVQHLILEKIKIIKEEEIVNDRVGQARWGKNIGPCMWLIQNSVSNAFLSSFSQKYEVDGMNNTKLLNIQNLQSEKNNKKIRSTDITFQHEF